jgi:hypothetical protein
VTEAVRVIVVSRDHPQVVDAASSGPVEGTWGGVRAGSLGVWTNKRRKGTVGIAYKSVEIYSE